ncbi:MAG: hypothetical protein Q8J69_09940 [Sphingobacteriaceae bacterium]|nr:hypothetical protein [Sphingobacteriaceae bacterium]
MKILKSLSLSAFILTGAFAFTACQTEPMTPEPTPAEGRSMTYSYNFNIGQLGDGTAYNGNHPTNMTGTMIITELAANRCLVQVELHNTVEGAVYMVHAHDAADPATTPNGTPYIETPNSEVLTLALTSRGHDHGHGGGHGHRVSHITAKGGQEVNRTFEYLTSNYQGFLVVHDPLQAISTTDLTTYLVVSPFARD